MIRLILASASPRRRELLEQCGFAFDVIPAEICEDVRPEEAPAAYVERLAREKAGLVYQQQAGPSSSPVQVIGADTAVIVDGQILGKPADEADAARMLRLLSGRTHQVITGVALATEVGVVSSSETTEVEFLPMSEEEIAAYIETGEPMDKAGAYAIQGIAAQWIPRIVGDYSNVVGLPLARLCTMIKTLMAGFPGMMG